MEYLADTNVVLRWALEADPLHAVVRSAVIRLRELGHRVVVCPQNLVELHAVATRPAAANGLGLASSEARAMATLVQAAFPVLAESAQVHIQWQALVDRYGVIGRQAFDVRIVAVMLSHGVTRLLTLDPTHFVRFAEIEVLTPQQVARDGAGPQGMPA